MDIVNSLGNIFFGDKVKGKVVINGVEYSGSNININSSGSVTIDGSIVSTVSDKVINIVVQGDCDSVDTSSGDIKVWGNVNGNVNASSGDIDVEGDVKGNVNTSSGDVHADKIYGRTSTISGDIY